MNVSSDGSETCSTYIIKSRGVEQFEGGKGRVLYRQDIA